MFWCGYISSGLRFLTIAAIISLVLGAAVGILTLRKRDVKIPIVVMFGVFFTLNFSCCGYWMWCGSNFECDRGFGDYFRLPVKYPYQISSIDGVDEGCLDVWDKDDLPIVCGITDYTVHFSLIVGKIGNPGANMGCPAYEKWFSFDMDTGDLACYPSQLAFIDACKKLGISNGMPKLKSVSEHYRNASYPMSWLFVPDFW